MNIVVCVKQVIDGNTTISIGKDDKSVDSSSLTYITNPCDIVAVKWATGYMERSKSGEVTVVSMGSTKAERSIRDCFAHGVNKAMLLTDPSFEISDGLVTGRVLARAIKLLQCDLVLCGSQSYGSSIGWTSAVIANILDIPLISRVTEIKIDKEERRITTQRKLDNMRREVVEIEPPCLLTVDPLLDRPRFPSVRSIRRAQTQEIGHYDREDLNLSLEEVGQAGLKTQIVRLLPGRPRPKMVFTPDSSLPAPERIKLVMSGGMTEKKGNVLEGEPSDLAMKLVDFIKQRKLLS